MTIRVTLNKKEATLVNLFLKHQTLSTVDGFKGWRDSKEFNDLEENNLIYHCNARSHGEFIAYALTSFGLLAAKQNNLTKCRSDIV